MSAENYADADQRGIQIQENRRSLLQYYCAYTALYSGAAISLVIGFGESQSVAGTSDIAEAIKGGLIIGSLTGALMAVLPAIYFGRLANILVREPLPPNIAPLDTMTDLHELFDDAAMHESDRVTRWRMRTSLQTAVGLTALIFDVSIPILFLLVWKG